MKYLTFLALTLTDWVLTKLALFAGMTEGNPLVSLVGGIDNALITKIVAWAAIVVLVPALNNCWPKKGDQVLTGAILLYAGLVLWNACMIAWPILTIPM
jgi:hypothetical protein